MPSIRKFRRKIRHKLHSTALPAAFALAAGFMMAGSIFGFGGVPAAFAQDAAPEAAPEPQGEAAPARSKPKPRPKKPAPKPAETEAKPQDGAKPAASEGTLLEPAAQGGTAAVWPNGARSVSEGYGDWTVNCNREGTHNDCVVIQSQGDRRTGRRQFSIELRTPKDGRTEGLILMPFGLQIEPGVTFKLDDQVLGKGAPYTTCVNDGCLVPISLPTLATDTMRTAQNLTVTATKPDAKEPTVLTVPLAGFAAAFARAAALGN